MVGLCPLSVQLSFDGLLINIVLESSLINVQSLSRLANSLSCCRLDLLNHLDKLVFLSLNLGLGFLQYSNTKQGLNLAGLLDDLLEVDQLFGYNLLRLHYFLDFDRLLNLIRFYKLLSHKSLWQNTQKLFAIVLVHQLWLYLIHCYFLDR